MRRATLYSAFVFTFLVAFAAATLQGCRTTRKAQTVAVDSTTTAATVVNAAHHTADSVAHQSTAAVGSHVVETATQVTELYDTAGRVTARTTTTFERHTSTNATATEQTIETHTTTDTIARRDTAANSVQTIATTEVTKEPAAAHHPLRLRLRWLLLGIVAAFCLVVWHQIKHQTRNT